jgi:transposase
MSLVAAKLPENIDELRAFAACLQDELYAKTLHLEKVKAQLAVLKRARFGRSSEKLDRDIEQMELMLGELEEGQAQVQAKREKQADAVASPGVQVEAKKQRAEKARRELPEHLSRERVEHKPDCVCPNCGGNRLRQIGVDERNVLEYVPSHFKVIVHARPKMACKDCESINQAPMPSMPIVKGLPGPALLAHVIVSKYCDHLPLHRQSDIYAREGVDLDRSLLAAWVGHMAELLTPLTEAIGKHVRQGETLHADDTPVPVLEPGRGKTRTGRLWTAVRDERPWGSLIPPAAFYQYSPDRTGARAENLLEGCKGYLHADAYAGFNRLYDPDPKTGQPSLIEVSCWAHARRKIYDVYEATKSPVALDLLERMGKLFDIERLINGKPPDERIRTRTQQSVPLLDELKRAFEAALNKISGKSTLAGAIRYAYGRWPSLTRYTTDGRLEMTNNAAERAIRPLALGRKNWLFAGSDTGGDRAAIMYTLIETAKMNDLNPEAYLRDIIARIADHHINKIDQLLPWNYIVKPL